MRCREIPAALRLPLEHVGIITRRTIVVQARPGQANVQPLLLLHVVSSPLDRTLLCLGSGFALPSWF